MPPSDPPSLVVDACPCASDPAEAWLSWPPMVRYLDACILRAVKPWSKQLGADDFAEIRRLAYAELSLDPMLRGLLRQLALAFEARALSKMTAAGARAPATSRVE